jgi:hypothetical protein
MPLLPSERDGHRLIILGVHGTPTCYPNPQERRTVCDDPRSQLGPIKQHIAQEGTQESLTWLDCPWLLGETEQSWPVTLDWDEIDEGERTRLARDPYKLLSNTGVFSNKYVVPQFRRWFEERIKELPSNERVRLVVVAYSAGGYLVYRFLEQVAVGDVSLVKSIDTIICIASPFHWEFGQPVVFTLTEDNQVSKPIVVKEPAIDPTLLVKRLRRSQLVVLQAQEFSPEGVATGAVAGDKTVLYENSSFLANNFEATEILEIPPIEGTNHLTILDHPATKKYVLDHLS